MGVSFSQQKHAAAQAVTEAVYQPNPVPASACLWCVVYALSLSGVKNITAVQALNHCLSNLFICKVNKTDLKDKRNQNYLQSYSASRLQRSLEVAIGDVDDSYDDRVAERMFVHLLPGTKYPTCDLHVSDFGSHSAFRTHKTKHCG